VQSCVKGCAAAPTCAAKLLRCTRSADVRGAVNARGREPANRVGMCIRRTDVCMAAEWLSAGYSCDRTLIGILVVEYGLWPLMAQHCSPAVSIKSQNNLLMTYMPIRATDK